MKKRILLAVILAAVLVCLLAISTSAVSDTITASGTCGSKLTWKLYDDGELVISGTGAMTEWNMAMFAPWYSKRSQITSIVIESGVTTIGYESFREFSNLTNVEIADTVTTIGEKAFRDCTSLKTLKLGKGVKTIENGAFSWCYSLTSVNIPDSVTTIDTTAFYYCTRLTSVEIGKSVTTIGNSAFDGCTRLKKAVVHSKTTRFGTSVFSGAASSFAIHGYLGSTAETYAQSNGHSFMAFTDGGTCGDNITWTLYESGNLVISGTGTITSQPWRDYRTHIKTATIENGVTDIGGYTFYYCESLTSVSLPTSVKNIGDKAFYYCTSLQSITIPDSVTDIGEYAFYHCTTLKSATIGNSVKSIGDYAFCNCTGLQSVTIGNSVKSIGGAAFSYCSSLTKATINSKTAAFGTNVFSSTAASFEIHGYIGSTANIYAAANAHKFAMLDTVEVTDTAAQAASSAFTIKLVDYKTGKPIVGASVALGGVSGTTDSTGKISLTKPSAPYSNLIVSANGYVSRGIMGYSSYRNTGLDVIKMYPVGITQIIPELCNGISIDTARAQINNKADMYAEIVIDGVSEYTINKFQIRQGGTILGESADGNFTIHNSAFKKGVPVTAYMHTQAGTFYKELNIDVVSFAFFPSAFPLGAETIKVPDDITLFGGVEIKLEHGKHSVEVEVTNSQIKVGYNQTVKEKDFKKMNQGLRNWMNANGRKVTSEKTGFEVGGYVLVDIGNNGVKSATGQVVLSFNYSNGAGKTFFLLVPIRVEADFEVEGQASITLLGYDFENAKLIWPALDASFGGSVTAKAGVGGYLASAGVYGSLGLKLDLNVLPKFMVDSLIASGEIGLYAKAVVLGEAKLPLIDGDLVLYDKDRATTYSLRRAALYSVDAYTLSSRSYLDSRSEWYGSTYGTLQTSVYGSADPMLATAGDTTVMVWLDDNGSTDEYNYQQLMYSVLTESGWSAPVGVDTNALNDAEYELYSDGENIWLICTEANRAISAEDDMTDMAGTLEIVISRYDATLGAFTDRTVITNDNTMDTKPNITVACGILTAVWVNNADNNIFGMSSDNTIYMSQYADGEWSTPTVIADSTPALTALDAGTLGGSLAISAIHDTDSDFATVGDSVLTVYKQNGEHTSLTEGGYASVLFDSDKLYYYDSGAVHIIDTYGSDANLVSDELSTDSAPDFDIVSAGGRTYLMYRVYYAEEYYGGSNIYAIMLNDGAASSPIKLTDTWGYVDSFGASDTEEGLTVVYRRTDASFTDDELNTTSDLCSMVFTPDVRLEITDIEFDHTDLFDDDKVTLTVSVRNAGVKTANGFTLSYYWDTVIAEYSGSIAAGETVELETTYTLNGTDSEYVFVVTDEYGYTYMEYVTLGYTDFAVTAESRLIGGIPYVNVDVTNSGNLSGSSTLNVYSEDKNGAIIYTEDITLNVGEQKYLLLEVINPEIEKVYVEIAANYLDYADGDNYAVANAYVYTEENGSDTEISFIPTTDNPALAPDTQILAITAGENDTTYSMGDTNFYWSSRYNAYLAIVGDDVTEDDVKSLLTATEGADSDVIAYDGDVNGDGKVTAGDAALVARLLANPHFDGCTNLMRFEADAYASAEDSGYCVTLDDAKCILYAAVGLEYNG